LALTWFITGASRGFGLEIVRLALGRGDSVAATARHPEHIARDLGQHANLELIALDVTNEDQVEGAVASAVKRFERIDVLVNNAGRGFIGAVEEASADDVSSLFAVNVFGLLSVTRAVLPTMRRQRSGRIVNMSSVGGISGRAGLGVYAASKFAVEGLSEGLRQELAPLGITVTLIEPGAFRTDFLDPSSMKFPENSIEDYAGTSGAVRKGIGDLNHKQRGDPHKAAEAILEIVLTPSPPLRLPLGADSVARVEDKLEHVTGELATWRELASSTDFGE
jgi:NAD(P)-dependent dehydrogenase (short-subunit alcohol dehydrogenase family)